MDTTGHSPHVDEILGERHGVRIAGDGDGAIRGGALALFAIANAYHGTGYLAYLGDLGAALADNAANQLVRHGHLVRLIVGGRLLSAVLVVGAQLTAGQGCQC